MESTSGVAKRRPGIVRKAYRHRQVPSGFSVAVQDRLPDAPLLGEFVLALYVVNVNGLSARRGFPLCRYPYPLLNALQLASAAPKALRALRALDSPALQSSIASVLEYRSGERRGRHSCHRYESAAERHIPSQRFRLHTPRPGT